MRIIVVLVCLSIPSVCVTSGYHWLFQ